MCGRNSLFVPDWLLEKRFDAIHQYNRNPRYNIAPGTTQATISNDAPNHIRPYEWGVIPSWNTERRLINARAESLTEKQPFMDLFQTRRCLVLADGFYEWQHQANGPNQPYRVQRTDQDPFAFAGLWQPSPNHDSKRHVTIVTTEPNETLAPIHDRMPVILRTENESTWLEQTHPDELHHLIKPYPDDSLEAYPISTRINNPANDSPKVIEPLGSTQIGFDAFAPNNDH